MDKVCTSLRGAETKIGPNSASKLKSKAMMAAPMRAIIVFLSFHHLQVRDTLDCHVPFKLSFKSLGNFNPNIINDCVCHMYRQQCKGMGWTDNTLFCPLERFWNHAREATAFYKGHHLALAV